MADMRHMARMGPYFLPAEEAPRPATWFIRPTEEADFADLAPRGTRLIGYWLIPAGDCIVTRRPDPPLPGASQEEIGNWLVANGLLSRREPLPLEDRLAKHAGDIKAELAGMFYAPFCFTGENAGERGEAAYSTPAAARATVLADLAVARGEAAYGKRIYPEMAQLTDKAEGEPFSLAMLDRAVANIEAQDLRRRELTREEVLAAYPPEPAKPKRRKKRRR